MDRAHTAAEVASTGTPGSPKATVPDVKNRLDNGENPTMMTPVTAQTTFGDLSQRRIAMPEDVTPQRALEQLAPEARGRVELAFKKMIEEEVALAARRPGHDKTHDRVRNVVMGTGTEAERG